MASWLLYFMNHNNSFVVFFNGTIAVSIYNFAKKDIYVIAPYYYNHTKKDILIAKEKKTHRWTT